MSQGGTIITTKRDSKGRFTKAIEEAETSESLYEEHARELENPVTPDQAVVNAYRARNAEVEGLEHPLVYSIFTSWITFDQLLAEAPAGVTEFRLAQAMKAAKDPSTKGVMLPVEALAAAPDGDESSGRRFVFTPGRSAKHGRGLVIQSIEPIEEQVTRYRRNGKGDLVEHVEVAVRDQWSYAGFWPEDAEFTAHKAMSVLRGLKADYYDRLNSFSDEELDDEDIF